MKLLNAIEGVVDVCFISLLSHVRSCEKGIPELSFIDCQSHLACGYFAIGATIHPKESFSCLILFPELV